MTIEQIDNTKLLISLCSQDMRDFSLNFDTMSLWDDHSRKVLSRLLHLAGNKTGMTIDKRSVLVEAVPYDFGCILLVSLLEKSVKRKVYKVKKLEGKPCVRFSSVTDLMDCAKVLQRQGVALHRNSLWLYEGEYYLMSDYPYISDRARGILTEFGTLLRMRDTGIASVKEKGKVLCEGDAMNIIGLRI